MNLTPYTALIARIGRELAELVATHECPAELSPRASLLDADMAEILRAIGREAMQALYGLLTDREVEQCHQEGLTIHRNPTIDFHVIFGTISLESPYLWAPGVSAKPVRDVLGITHRGRSDTVNRALSDFGSEVSFEQAASRFAEHYHYTLPARTVDRVTKAVAQDALEFVQYRLALAAEHGTPPQSAPADVETLLIELDGCKIRTGQIQLVWPEPLPAGESAMEQEEAPSLSLMGPPQRKKSVGWKEVRLGLARPITAKEKLYVGRLAPGYTDIVQDLQRIALWAGLQAETAVVAVADGGNGLREALEEHFAAWPFQFILDHRHLCDHLYATADALHIPATEQTAWVGNWLDLLDEGAIHYTVQELTKVFHQTAEHRVEQLIAYLERFCDATHYDEFRACDYPIGSGEIESAHKSVPQHRLKLPGACWHPRSLNPMMGLRIVRANQWWDDYWEDRTARKCAA